VRKYVAHCLLLKQKQPDAASWLLSLQRSKRWDPWTGNNFFSITKQMFAAFYFNRSRSRVDKQSLRGNNFWMTEKWWVVWQPIRREKKIWAKLWCGVVYNKFISLFGWTTKMLLKWIQDSRSKCVFGIAVAVVVVVWKKLFYKKYF